MKSLVKILIAVQFVASLLFFTTSAQALTLEELRNTSDLTPETFANYFSDFKFKFHDDVQEPNTFLASKSGDCDDYATIAADVLGRRGYTTRLVAVRMKGETHVVCYVAETRSYLDYNMRKEEIKLVPCSSVLTEIAKKVAQSFEREWVATYEFTYQQQEKVKRLVDKIVSNRSV